MLPDYLQKASSVPPDGTHIERMHAENRYRNWIRQYNEVFRQRENRTFSASQAAEMRGLSSVNTSSRCNPFRMKRYV